jgi:carboxyvinyl-carboxyphosphonate phosphorylmutase
MLSATDKRLVFRGVLKGDVCRTPASVFDALSARAAQDIGYEVAVLGGSVASLAVLGAPDIALLTLTDLVEQVRRICRAGDVPLLVDGDHGYGNALNARRTIEDIEAAGAAAITIEDAALPGAFGSGDTALISLRELSGKVRAAADARTDASFVLVGRTSASLAASRAELLERQSVLHEAGADAVFVTGVKSLQVLDALAAGARVPLILGAAPQGVSSAELCERRVRICLAGHQAYFDGVAATYRRLLQQRTGAISNDVETKTLVEQLSRAERYERWAKQFLT